MNIVVNGGILKTSVGTSMADHMNHLNEAAPTSLPPNLLDGGLSKEEIEAFKHLVSHLDHPSNAPSSSFAYSRTCICFVYFLSLVFQALGLLIQGPPTI